MRTLSVSEFLAGVNDTLAGVPALVEGELSGFAIRQERWAFFSLRDEEAVVECFMPSWKLRHEVTDGMLVRVAGAPQVYVKSGRFRIVVEALEPVGEGSLKRAFELLKQKLEREGLFASPRKRVLPRFPEVIGVIASKESAAYTDFLRILRNRWGGTSVLLADVPVQGDAAVSAIASGLHHFAHMAKSGQDEIANSKFQIPHQCPEVLVLTRGGGSLEDLQAFNTEEVARAIFASPIPVVVGVGHERDVTIADLVADVRASTPSNAAELVVPDRRDVTNEVDAMVDGVASQLQIAHAQRRSTLDRFFHHGGAFAQQRRAHIDAATALLSTGFAARCQRIAARLDAAERLVGNLNPSRLLARGYSMTIARGSVVRDISAIAVGDQLITHFGRGSAESSVQRLSTP